MFFSAGTSVKRVRANRPRLQSSRRRPSFSIGWWSDGVMVPRRGYRPEPRVLALGIVIPKWRALTGRQNKCEIGRRSTPSVALTGRNIKLENSQG
jgi:hypothetical protein